MDFEFQNGTGPVDGRSPFAQLSTNTQRIPQGMSSPAKKRTHNAYDSPSKSRMMGHQQSSPSKPLPAPPAWSNNLFNTPRKPRDDIDDSSAGETPRSPEQNNDSDATPDTMNLRSAVRKVENANAPTVAGAERERGGPTKERPGPSRRESIIGAIRTGMKKMYSPGEDTANAPQHRTCTDLTIAGRGELARPDHTGAIEKRTSKKRKREVDRRVARQRRHSVSDSGEDNDRQATSPRKTSGQMSDSNKPHWISNLFTFIGQHPTVPHILSFYAQLLFNVGLLCGCGYLIYCFWSAVQGDVDKKSHEAKAAILLQMAGCLKEYQDHNCDLLKHAPKFEMMCKGWDDCTKQDPNKTGRAKVSAHTFAEIFNSFVDPISWKAMAFTLILVSGSFFFSNLAFGFFRSKTQEYQPNYGYGYGPPPPPTPQRSFSGQDGGFYAGTPWHQPPSGLGFEPQSSGGFEQIEGRGSPVRRLVYN